MNEPTQGDLAIRLRGIRKRFGYREVLRGVDLDVNVGDCVALFGANGAGKSTLLRIVATQWAASQGEGQIFGHDLRRAAREVRKLTGVVSHQSFLRNELSLQENLAFFGDLFEVDWRKKGQPLLEKLQLATRLRDRVQTFSQGMTKRANIIRSLLHAPKLWILDEPFSGLDPDGRTLLFSMISEFVSGGGTVLLVTHQVETGSSLATRCLEIEAGKLRAVEPAALFKRHSAPDSGSDFGENANLKSEGTS